MYLHILAYIEVEYEPGLAIPWYHSVSLLISRCLQRETHAQQPYILCMFADCWACISNCLYHSKHILSKVLTILACVAVFAFLMYLRRPHEATAFTEAFSDADQLMLGIGTAYVFLKNALELIEDNPQWYGCLLCCKPLPALPILNPTEVRSHVVDRHLLCDLTVLSNLSCR